MMQRLDCFRRKSYPKAGVGILPFLFGNHIIWGFASTYCVKNKPEINMLCQKDCFSWRFRV